MRMALLVLALSALQRASATPTDSTDSADAPTTSEAEGEGLARIVGGRPGRAGQFPFVAHIVVSGGAGRWLCCGSVLTANVVVTAGHCAKLGSLFQLRMGLVDLAGPSVERSTATKLVHERQGADGAFANDIALLHFAPPLDFNDVLQPIQLPGADGGSHVRDEVFLVGWGHHTNHDRLQNVLHFTRSTVVSNLVCGLRHHDDDEEFIHGSNICVAGSKTKGPCGGDSGGPLVYYGWEGRATLIGLSSFNYKEDCESDVPRVYTRVSAYRRWIQRGIHSFGP